MPSAPDAALIFRRHERDQDPLGPGPRSSAPSCSPSSGGRRNGPPGGSAFQPQLGQPWFELFGWPVYQPPAFFWWWFAYDAYAPRDLRRGRLHRRVRRHRRRRRGDRHVGLARAGGEEASRPMARRAGPRRARFARPACSATTASLLGRWRDDYLRHDGPEHVLCFAPTRSGKGVGLVVPTLLTWPGSAIVHDIKGENWTLTAGWRARFGRVLLFDPTNAQSAAYNPLLEVRRGEWEVRDVQNIADVLVDPEGALERRNHWEKTSHSLLVGAILHVLYAEPDKTLAGVANFLSDPRRPIETTLRAMMTTPHLGEARRASRRRQRRARAAQQERERALRRAVDRDVVPRPLPRSGRRDGHAPLRLAHPRPRRGRAPGDALPRRAALRHQPHQAARPPDPQPDRPAADRGA